MLTTVKHYAALILTAPVRKAIYGLVAAGFALAFAFGVGTDADQAFVLSVLDHGFDLLTALVGVMAFINTPTEK